MPSRVDSRVCVEGLPSVTSTSGIHQFDLPLDEGQADLRFLRRRRAVAGRPPRDDIGDVGLAAVEPDRRDHPVQQLAGTSDERQALDVLVAPGRFADEHDARLRIAVGKHQPRRGVFQRAAVEIFQQRAQRLQRRRGSRRFPRRCDRRLRRAALSRCAAAGIAAGGVLIKGRGGAVSRARCGGAGRVGIGQPVDRLVRQRAVDPGLQIKGQQLLNGRRGFGRSKSALCQSRMDRAGTKRLDIAFPWLSSPQKSETTSL